MGWIVEAKKSSARPFVRMAIGQVLDYAHLARKDHRPVVPVIVLPEEPTDDLKELIVSLNITLIVRQGQISRWSALKCLV
jgi:hypothetical protein